MAERILRKLGLVGLHQEGVQTTAVLDRAQRVGRNPQGGTILQLIGRLRHVDEVRQEDLLGLAVRVADLWPTRTALAGESTASAMVNHP